MAHEILSVKLCELEDQLSRISSRIHLSETGGHDQLQQEIKMLSKECTETKLTLQKKLRLSRAKIVANVASTYGEIENIIHATQTQIKMQSDCRNDLNKIVEDKILIAEYALDFAALAANRALLLSMEAIDAQLIEEERKTS